MLVARPTSCLRIEVRISLEHLRFSVVLLLVVVSVVNQQVLPFIPSEPSFSAILSVLTYTSPDDDAYQTYQSITRIPGITL